MSATHYALPTLVAAPRGRGLWERLGEFGRAFVTRRQLVELDGRMLSDIGVTRAEALAEANRAPWDLTPAILNRSGR